MKLFQVTAAALALTVASVATAAEIESGIPVGGKIGAYSQTKVCGVADGKKDGSSFCYT